MYTTGICRWLARICEINMKDTDDQSAGQTKAAFDDTKWRWHEPGPESAVSANTREDNTSSFLSLYFLSDIIRFYRQKKYKQLNDIYKI